MGRGRPKKNKIEPIDDVEEIETLEDLKSISPLPKKKKGRPFGSKNKFKDVVEKTKTLEFIVDPEKLFLFIKRETIPKKELIRFLRLCDQFIRSLGPDTLNDTDLEEIALIYRDRVYMDLAYQVFAKAEAIDTAMITQIEKINKSLEVRKSNLGSRFIDRDKARKGDGSNTFLELFNYFVENKDLELQKAREMQVTISGNKTSFTDTSDYMENKLRNKSALVVDEESN